MCCALAVPGAGGLLAGGRAGGRRGRGPTALQVGTDALADNARAFADCCRSVTRSYYRGAAGALLVYDISRYVTQLRSCRSGTGQFKRGLLRALRARAHGVPYRWDMGQTPTRSSPGPWPKSREGFPGAVPTANNASASGCGFLWVVPQPRNVQCAHQLAHRRAHAGKPRHCDCAGGQQEGLGGMPARCPISVVRACYCCCCCCWTRHFLLPRVLCRAGCVSMAVLRAGTGFVNNRGAWSRGALVPLPTSIQAAVPTVGVFVRAATRT